MRIHICAVGRLKAGPERTLIDDYLLRFERIGRAHGLAPTKLNEVEDKKNGGMAGEAALLSKSIPDRAVLCALDERGKLMSSPDFATQIAGWRDSGVQDAAFVIGGADGIASDLRARADVTLSLGKMVWPHMLARVMLCEQLYRAASILDSSPYHRI